MPNFAPPEREFIFEIRFYRHFAPLERQPFASRQLEHVSSVSPFGEQWHGFV